MLFLHVPTRAHASLSKVHLSDPDIEGKAHEDVETVALVGSDRNGKDSRVSSSGSSRPVGVLQDFFTTPLIK